MLEAFFEGMNLAIKYDNAQVCMLAFTSLMDDFYFMNINHTTALNQEERFMNVTGVVANNYAETFYQCFVFSTQIQEEAVNRFATFVDGNDVFTSFLFNLLSNSIVI